ncbi:hypothetical protein J7T55_010824 [Diaporthe amygdali]|uniref:uncharacterized protein n=1 Tax=Phomopsis amygdali TaxID=1214568 RepID=UPI0022FDE59C|nr:uncharacterized protein J7T55_010824 [Diaporthe amygdali]KAJ0114435.1 hypothetical protein J7T55_010824 [Diaporthe amygdali]
MAASDETILRRLSKGMEDVECILRECRNSSVMVGVLHEGEVIFSAGCGFRDVAKGEKPTDETLYTIASVSKTFVVAALGILVAERKVKWTDVVGNYIPEFQPRDDARVSTVATFKDFLRHSGGITNYVVPISGPKGSLTVDAEHFMLSANSTPTGDNFGSFYDRTFEYSNIGYALVALAIERISGMRYADFVRDRILEPLGMNATAIYESQLLNCGNVALGEIRLDDGTWILQNHEWTSEKKTHTLATFGIRSSVKDMLTWCSAMMDAFHGDTSTPLKQVDTILDDHYWQWPARSADENVAAFHLGWLKVVLPHRMIHWGNCNQTLANGAFATDLEYINAHVLGQTSRKILSYQAMGTSSDGTAAVRFFPQTRSAIVVLSSGINYADPSDFTAAVMTQELFELTPRVCILPMAQRECRYQKQRFENMLSDWLKHRNTTALKPSHEDAVDNKL